MMTLFDKHEPEAMLPPITLGEKITPRDYQQEALDGFFRSYAEGSRHMMARLATGCGKTLTAALIAERWLAKGPRHRVMVMAYESILVDQFADEMREFLPHIQTRVEMANEAIVHIPQIVVASRQSLYIDKSGRSRLFKFPNQDLNWLVVCDEAHGYKASMASFTHIVQWFEENPANVFLGLTATPQRGDGVSLKRLFGTVVAELRLSKAINDGWLVPFKQKFIRVDGVDFKALKTVAGDWTSAELDNILSEQEQLTSMAIPLLEQTEGKRTLVFTPGVACAQKLAQVINAEIKIRGLPHGKAESMHGGTPRDERQAIIEQHQSGQIQYLVVCGLCLSKGTMVLTDRGEVPIEQVTTEMKLWDGIEYVSHDGVIAKGVRPVITYAGLTATEDHRVWTDRGWEQLATCKKQRINIRISAIGGKAVRESCGYYRGGDQNWQVPSNRIGSSVQYVWETICKGLQRIKARQIWMQALLKKQRSSELAFGQMSAPKIAVHKRVQQALHGLWRKRNRVSLFIPGGGRPVDHEQSWPTRRFVFGPNRQQRSLRTGELALVHMDGASEQQTEEAKGISEEEAFFKCHSTE